MIKIIVRKDKEYLQFENGVILGEIYKEVDGFYVFQPTLNGGGFWEEWVLKGIASILEERNAAWKEEIDNYFRSQPQKGTVDF